MHGSMFGVTLVSVTIEFIAEDHSPVSFVSVTLSLEVALSLVEGVLLFSALVAIVLNDLLFIGCIVLLNIV